MQPLVQAAMDQIWSTPDATNQVIIHPTRLTPPGGAIGTYSFLRESYTLPVSTSYFHLYQLGQVYPGAINLFSVMGQWELLSDACNAIQMVANIYTAKGIELPRTRTWYYVSDDRNVVLAVERNSRIPFDFDADAVYLRTYRNAFFQNPSYSTNAVLTVQGGLMTTQAAIVALQSQLTTYLGSSGYAGGLYCFVNGIKVSTISTATCAVGDVAEFVYDSSIYKVVDFQVSGLKSFTSTLDAKNKYLLHYPTGWDGQIDYQDNVDMYVISSITQKGRYINKNDAAMMRQLTFKDYSVAADNLTPLFQQFTDSNGNLSLSTLYLRLHIRYDGNAQYPTFEANRLHYLLKLSDAQQVAAMVGVDATVPVWNAANLEQCAYTRLMRTDYRHLTLPMAEQAFGYSAANKILATNFQTVTNHTAPVPPAMQAGCVAYEYDSQGNLFQFYNVASGTLTYACVDTRTAMVEFIAGQASTTLDEVYGETSLTLGTNLNYRFYTRVTNGQSQTSWTDVTGQTSGSGAQYTVSNGVATWVATGNSNRIARSDAKFLGYTVTLNPSDGVLQHAVKNTPGGGSSQTLTVPLGEFDFWLNGKALVLGIDYLFHFPTLTIFSKAVLVSAPGPQVLVVRGTGFCKSDLSLQNTGETGFVWNGVLSVDHGYAVHYGKSERVTVGGLLQNPSTVPYVEDVSSGGLTNGQPYQVREYLNHLNGYLDVDPYAYYGTDLATDQSVSAYLNLKLGQTVQGPLNPISGLYKLYSPFLCKVMYAIQGGNIPSASYTGNYDDNAVRALCAPYEFLLAGDPILQGNTPDLRYVVIEPHWLTTTVLLAADAYRFFANVARIYGGGLVALPDLVAVSS